ncbi:hypothetical protein ACFTWS_14920 [Streptomyces sp. NPDC057027]|uniref:baeRF2 domain-containing protein n=1 Tax=Streptomyces sp. NPDC057027 TaxID=3346004 RepID=UPI003636FAA7
MPKPAQTPDQGHARTSPPRKGPATGWLNAASGIGRELEGQARPLNAETVVVAGGARARGILVRRLPTDKGVVLPGTCVLFALDAQSPSGGRVRD